jgi:ethanolamine utilization protein EutQ (cupin superfamily)
MVFYFAAEAGGREAMLAKLGKHKTGKACIYVKKLSDVDTEILKSMAQESVNYLQKLYPPSNA